MYPNKDITIHLLDHSKPVEGCDFCDMNQDSWPPTHWTREDLEKYARAMQRESADSKSSGLIRQ